MSTPAERQAARLSMRTEVGGVLVAPAEAPHGTYSCYCNWGCRCGSCSRAWTTYVTRRRVERRTALVEDEDGFTVVDRPGTEHGTYSTYKNWNCRCRPCIRAATAYRRELRQRQKVVAS